jgi:hypothetical protein
MPALPEEEVGLLWDGRYSRRMPTRELRFAACTPNGSAISEPWRVWTTPEGSAYVAVRALGGVCKVSLHGSGDWRFGHTKDYVDRKRMEGLHERDVVIRKPGVSDLSALPERLMDQWQRPQPNTAGLTDAIRLIVPALSCTRLPWPSTRSKPIQYVAVPRAMMLTFAVVLGPRDHPLGSPRVRYVPSCTVGSLSLGADQTLWVVAAVEPLHQGIMESFVCRSDKFTEESLAFHLGEPLTGGITSFGFLNDPNSTPTMLDLDPLCAVALRLAYLSDHEAQATDEYARLEAFGKELHKRREQAKAEFLASSPPAV